MLNYEDKVTSHTDILKLKLLLSGTSINMIPYLETIVKFMKNILVTVQQDRMLPGHAD